MGSWLLLTETTMCLCFLIVLVLTARSYRDPTTIAKPLLIVMICIFNGPCDRHYAITYRPTPTRSFRWIRFKLPMRLETHPKCQTINI